MVTGSKKVLLSQSISANGVTTSEASELSPGSKNLILLTTVSNYTDGLYALEVEHSPDGVNWESYGTVSAATAAGIELTRVSTSSFHLFRAKLTASAVITGADVECSIMFTPNRL